MSKFVGFFFALVVLQLSLAQDPENEEDTRIVNGQQARSGQFPWMVGVHGLGDNGQWEFWRCGGALISRNLVLTAEHCVDAKPRAYRITLGSTLAGDRQDGDGKTIRFADLIIKHGDALILRLSQSVSFNSKIQPVRLPGPNDYVGSDVDVTVSGWGGTGNGLSEKLLYTTLGTITNAKCSEWYGTLKNDVLCYVNQHSTTCGGDSGSPVVRYTNAGAVHVGIHNAGVCKVGSPSLATRTASHVDWINSEIRRHSS
ncbi:elastase-1-like [Atheta coriaria]|uniref:elastase-1-like n=1 Tax=Dalotia coriaria TaxID=877792 RepID=UPI0031F3F570